MRTLFTLAFMLLITVPIGIFACRYFSDGWMYAIGLVVGLLGANLANIIYDIFLKTWIEDDGN